MTYKCSVNLNPYKIESIDTTEPPSGAEGSNWYHYVIVQGHNTIHGYRQGSLESVKLAVEENVDQLNERQLGKRGRVHLVTNPKKQNPK